MSWWGSPGKTYTVRLNTLFARELVQRARQGLEQIFSLETQNILEPALTDMDKKDVPMDFAGANALYFWELFYYVPMLVTQCLIQEQHFDETTRWLSHIFKPGAKHGDEQVWKVRPLLEDTRWNEVPLDSTNPDAVAQANPTHYKAATFMRLQSLLVARGDSTYRQLERDTLAEAKMWYVQALALMGDEPASKVVHFLVIPALVPNRAAFQVLVHPAHTNWSCLFTMGEHCVL
nr:hypothetical protein FFPRI1PSEUD_21250 [Pseudomonas sp. FFPRI_1]